MMIYIELKLFHMIRLLDNGKPARYPEINVHTSWNNCDFETIDQLVDYADRWLGKLTPGKIVLKNLLRGERAYFYGGATDSLSIVNVGSET